MTLRERAALDVRPSGCFICDLPGDRRAQIDEILRDRQELTKSAMIRLSKSKGYGVTRNRLNYHEKEGHRRSAALPKEGKRDTRRIRGCTEIEKPRDPEREPEISTAARVSLPVPYALAAPNDDCAAPMPQPDPAQLSAPNSCAFELLPPADGAASHPPANESRLHLMRPSLRLLQGTRTKF